MPASAITPSQLSLFDRLIGPYASPAERWLSFGSSLAAGVAMAIAAWHWQLNWSLWQYGLGILLAMDICGGVVSNACVGAKRWFHRRGISKGKHLVFIALHAIQLALFSWAFLDFNLSWLTTAWLWLMFASTVIINAPYYLQRPLAMALYIASLVLCFYVLAVPAELAWFLPLFYLKLLIAYLLTDKAPTKERLHD
ncbi:hypothetical protein [Motilimonas sp. KMU-193]|uniref:hypothetical protein n=1 Tax=Motilimonas sp. KMU-193 TaxID=3388668 RepID=UPI00396B3050